MDQSLLSTSATGRTGGREESTMTANDETADIEALKLPALRAKLKALTGAETKSNNRPYLIKKVVAALAEQARPRATEAARGQEAGARPKRRRLAGSQRDPRLPAAGATLEREHDGKIVRVKVLEEGFQYNRKTYRSLSAIAKEITGTVWNGLLFSGWRSARRRASPTESSCASPAFRVDVWTSIG
jgi:hypothetical protein